MGPHGEVMLQVESVRCGVESSTPTSPVESVKCGLESGSPVESAKRPVESPADAARRLPARRFEDLVAWQKARELVREIYRLTRGPSFRRDPGLVDQLRRAAVSSMTNIAEGFERHSRTDFAHFLNIAGASAGEVRSHLYVVEDCELAPASATGELRDRAEEVGRVIGGLRTAVLRRRDETGK